MFPGVDGFRWTVGHILFLTIFFAVVATIMATVLRAALRTARQFRTHRAAEFCWKSDFGELPEAERRCRHELAGRVASRTCDNAFDCRTCKNYANFASLPAKALAHHLNIRYSPDRFYHRGHTWVELDKDGMVTIGLDDFADHLIGHPDSIALPKVGKEVDLNGAAWSLRKNGHEIQLRAPIEGTVIAVGGPDAGWYLKVRPRKDAHDPVTLRHLLRGVEVDGWLARELERLQQQFRAADPVPTLADGGEMVYGVMDAVPDADWDAVIEESFLAG